LAVRLLPQPQKVEFAIFSAEQVVGIYEEKYPDNLMPRKALEAAKDWLANPSVACAAAAYAAADAAGHAAAAAYASAAACAAYADDAAAAYAACADDAAAACAYAGDAAAAAAADDAAARAKMRRKIAEKAMLMMVDRIIV